MPNQQTENLRVRDYLLGLGQNGEHEKIEERLLTDDQFFEEFLATEEDLIQDYVDGDLTETEKTQFETHFLISPERKEKLKFAQSLRRNLDAQTTEETTSETAKEKTEKESTDSLNFFQKLFASPIPAFASLLIIFGISSLLVWNFFLRSNDTEIALASLNKAYKTERPLESRITGLDYAPLKNTRGVGDSKISQLELERAGEISKKAASENRSAESLHTVGRFYLTQKEFDRAIEELKNAEKLDSKNAQIQNDLGVAFLGKSRVSDKKLEFQSNASEKFEEALELNPNLLEAYFNRAIALQEQNLQNQAIEAWQEYLKRDSDSPWAEEAKKNLERLKSEADQSKTSDEILRSFLDAYQNRDNQKAYEIVSNNREMIRSKLIPQELVFLFLNTEKPEEKNRYLSALKLIGELEKQKTGDTYFFNIANFYSSISEQKKKKLLEAQQFVKVGYKESLDGSFEESNLQFKKAQDLFVETGNIWEARLCDYWIAYTDFQSDGIQAGTDRLEGLSQYCETNNFKWLNAHALYWLSINSKSTKDFSKSIQYAKESLKASEDTNDLYNTHKSLSWLADLYLLVNQTEKALDHLQKALEFAGHPDSSDRQKGRDFDVASRLFFAQGNYNVAGDFQKEMLHLYKTKIKDSSFERVGLANLGNIFAAQGKYNRALEFAKKGKEVSENIADKNVRAKAIGYAVLQIANIERKSKNCSNALNNYTQAIDIYRKMEFQSRLFDAMKGRLLCNFKEQNADAIERELPETIKFFEENRSKIVEEQNKNRFSEKEQDIYDLAIDFEMSRGNYEAAFNYSETSKARSLLDLMNSTVNLSADKKDLIIEKNSTPLRSDEIRQRLPENVQIIQYAVLDEKLVFWLVSKTGIKSFTHEISSKNLDQKILKFLEAIKTKNQDEQQKFSRELYEILFQPLENDIDKEKVIYFVPDKKLFHLPFAALISGKTGKYLIEDHPIAYAPSTNVFLISMRNSSEKTRLEEEKLLSVGNPSFDRNEFSDLPDLPSAKDEAKKIVRFYQNSTLLLEDEVTKQNLLREMKQADVIHFAGHYVVNEDAPLQSAFLIAKDEQDSKLANYELLEENIEKPKLIILSACDTAVEKYYKGEGMIGAGRAFLSMGVPTVVASQWQVESDATAELMGKFHKNRKSQNHTNASALRKAQIEMIKDSINEFQQPYFWAGFLKLGGIS